MFHGELNLWWAQLAQQATGIVQSAMVFACLSLWLHRKKLKAAARNLMPKSLRFNLLNLVFDSVLILAPLAYLSTVATLFLRGSGLIFLDGRLLAGLHDSIVVLLIIFLGDFVAYFRHRLEHSRAFWSSHVMHHSDTDMHWLTAYRFHPFNRLTTVLIDQGVLVVLGFPPWAIVLNGMFRHYYGMLIHANVPWTYGKLGSIFVSPAMHRWHHVRVGDGVGSNFATVFCFFDRLFGTFYLPGPCHQTLGVRDVEDNAFMRQLLLPAARLRELLFRRGESPQPSGLDIPRTRL